MAGPVIRSFSWLKFVLGKRSRHQIRTISVCLLYLAGVFSTGLELSLDPILDELTRYSHLGVLFLHFPYLRSQRPAGAFCHLTGVRLRTGRSWSLFWPRDSRELSNCISVLPLSIWVWLVISGPYPQLKTVVFPELICVWGEGVRNTSFVFTTLKRRIR